MTYVKSPSYLCVQIIGDDTTQALDSLHEDMAEFYNSASGDKAIIERPAIGQVRLIDMDAYYSLFILTSNSLTYARKPITCKLSNKNLVEPTKF